MSTLIGHSAVAERIRREHPPVSILTGPKSVGKWTAAEWLSVAWAVDTADMLRIKNLTPGTARLVTSFASMTPVSSARRLVIANIEYATDAAIQTILKTLEEPSSTDFILITRQPELPEAVASRGVIYRFSILSSPEVEQVLRSRNFNEGSAKRYAEASGGQVARALSLIDDKESKAVVLVAVNAIATQSPEALESVALKWTDNHTDLLAQWCQEAITQRWRLFLPEESTIHGHAIPIKVLMALRPGVRPRLVVRSSLMNLVRTL